MTQNRRMREPHLGPFHRLLDAFEELERRVRIKPVSLAEVEQIAQTHRLPAHELLTRASLETKLVIDYQKGEVRWVSR